MSILGKLSEEFCNWLKPFIVTKKGDVITHTSMVGGLFGRLNIPEASHVEWLQRYAVEWELNTHSLFFIERRTPVFRMHFDLDFSVDHVVDVDAVCSLSREATSCFRRFYPHVAENDEQWTCFVCSAPAVEKEPGVWKSGYHVLWPHLYVDQMQALQMRLQFVSFLESTYPNRYDWNTVVDKSVLSSNGLRMIGSDKACPCKTCRDWKTSAKTNCTNCYHGVKVENRSYDLTCFLRGDGMLYPNALDTLLDDVCERVRMCSTRSYRAEPTAGFVIPSDAVTDSELTAHRRKGGFSGVGSVARPNQGCGLVGAVHLEVNTEIGTKLCEFLRCLHAAWSTLEIREIFMQHHRDRFIIHVTGSGCHFCLHVGRTHQSSSIYFVVTRSGVTQQCWCPKVCSNDNTPCTRWQSPNVELTTWLRRALFEDDQCQDVRFEGWSMEALLLKTTENITELKKKVEGRARESKSELETPGVCGDELGQNTPHLELPGLTCGEVDAMSSAQLYMEFEKIRVSRRVEAQQAFATHVLKKQTHDGKGGNGRPLKRAKTAKTLSL